MLWGSGKVSEFTIDYSQCQNQATATLADMPSNQYSYWLSAGSPSGPSQAPRWSFQNTTAAGATIPNATCVIEFEVPSTISHPVFMYYKLTNYYQNHRRYVKSVDMDQLKGDAVSYSSVQGGQCQPLDVNGDKIVYPCGLIANSVFNDTFSNLTYTAPGAAATTYEMSQKGIVWSGEPKKYQPTSYSLDQIVPPPFWALRYPNGYTTDNPPPNLHNDEHFMNWMRTAGLPTFRALVAVAVIDGRRQAVHAQRQHRSLSWHLLDDDPAQCVRSRCPLTRADYPVLQFGGTKSIVFSNASWIGGKNPFLGWAYVTVAALCVLIGLLLTVRHLVKPRRLGDMNYLVRRRQASLMRPVLESAWRNHGWHCHGRWSLISVHHVTLHCTSLKWVCASAFRFS